MKRLILIPMLFVIHLAFSQKVDCNKLSATNIYFNSKDSIINVTVNYTDTSSNIHLNYPGIKSVIDQTDNLDTLSAKTLTPEYYVHLANTEQIYHLKYKKMSDYDNYKIVFVYNDLLGQTGENTCILTESNTDSLMCKYVKILNDTVTIDFENNRTDLKFSYQRQAFPYPNFEFKSTDSELIITNGFNQTYTMGNDYYDNLLCMNNCQTYSAYYGVSGNGGVNFSTTATETKYLKGKFVIGSLDKSRCYFDIVYKVVPPVTSAIENSELENNLIYPNPFENIINVKQNNTLYSIYDILGNEVLEGTINDNRINTESLKSGVYILEIEGVKHKVLKK